MIVNAKDSLGFMNKRRNKLKKDDLKKIGFGPGGYEIKKNLALPSLHLATVQCIPESTFILNSRSIMISSGPDYKYTY